MEPPSSTRDGEAADKPPPYDRECDFFLERSCELNEIGLSTDTLL